MIRVGIVGANPASGWAGTAHVPALAAAAGFEITAVATTREESARAAAAAYGARRWHVGAAGLAADPDVDLVVVSVRAAEHLEPARAALAAGRHVLVEWPLATTADDADALAAPAGVVHAVAAQAWHSPGARFVADLIAAGRIGAVEAVSYVGSGDPHGGSRVPAFLAGSQTRAAGNNLLTIMGGHGLVALERVAGPFAAVTGASVARTGEVPAHLAFVGRLDSGAVASVTLHGGNRSAPAGFELRVTGSDGVLVVTPRNPGEYINWADWRITAHGAGVEEVAVPESYVSAGGVSANLTHLYRDLARAITEGRPAAPGFHTAARIQRLLEDADR